MPKNRFSLTINGVETSRHTTLSAAKKAAENLNVSAGLGVIQDLYPQRPKGSKSPQRVPCRWRNVPSVDGWEMTAVVTV